MAEFKVAKKGNAGLEYRPKVYFFCHPDDFDRVFPGDTLPCFEKVCSDILSSRDDCAIFYSDDRTTPFDEDEIDISFDDINLFVIAVSERMLCSHDPNLQVRQVLDYAKRNKRNILPVLMELPTDDLLAKYSSPDNFGKLQYIDPHNNQKNVAYLNRMYTFFEERIVDPKENIQIHSSFTTSVFLSYRQKDGKYAKELMQYIHQTLGAYDVAIWYDEFLPCGEDWKININLAMDDVEKKSNLFILLVTPNVLEHVNGKKNYVTRVECPEAKDRRMNILPVEMVKTDYSLLKVEADFLPRCVSKDSSKLRDEIRAISKFPLNDECDEISAERLYYMGLGYLHGFGVEHNYRIALDLLYRSAKKGYLGALELLYDIAYLEIENNSNYLMSLHICCRIMECKESNDTKPFQDVYFKSVFLYCLARVGHEGAKIRRDAEDYICYHNCLLDNDDPMLVLGLKTIVQIDMLCGEYEDALEGYENVVFHMNRLGRNKFAAEEIGIVLRDYADLLGRKYHLIPKLEEEERVLEELCKKYPDDHPEVIKAREDIATTYGDMKRHDEAARINRLLLEIKTKSQSFGKRHPSTITTMYNLIRNLLDGPDVNGAYDEALALIRRALWVCYRTSPRPDFLIARLHHCIALIHLRRKPSDRKNAEKHFAKASYLLWFMHQPEDAYERGKMWYDIALLYIGLGDVYKGVYALCDNHEDLMFGRADERIYHLMLDYYCLLIDVCRKLYFDELECGKIDEIISRLEALPKSIDLHCEDVTSFLVDLLKRI